MRRKRGTRTLERVFAWWDSDSNRFTVVRLLFWTVFLLSILGTGYSAWAGTLPEWAISAYVTFAVTLVFATFQYAIKRSGDDDRARYLFDVRQAHLEGWRTERNLLVELARYAACRDTGHDWHPILPARASVRSRNAAKYWPAADTVEEIRTALRDSIDSGSLDDGSISLDLMAYSSETFVSLSREIVQFFDDLLSDDAKQLDKIQLRVRIMVRDTSDDTVWLVPMASDERRDVDYAEQLRIRFDNVRRSALAEFSDGLRELLLDGVLSFEVKAYRGEPLLKGVLVNGHRGVVGLYAIDELRSPRGWDYSGHAVTMCVADSSRPGFGEITARFFSNWFELLWASPQMSRSVEE